MTGNPLFRFRLIHDIEGTFEISEPIGWVDTKLVLERDQQYSSLIERFEGAFSFYGDNGTFNGGIDVIKFIEDTYGVDADLTVDIAVSFDDGDTYEQVFIGLYDFSENEENNKNQIQSAIIKDDFWTKFITRAETPVNLQSSTGLDGSTVDVITPQSTNLTSQKVEERHEDEQIEGFNTCLTYQESFTDPSFQADFPVNHFAQIGLDNKVIDELSFNHNIIFAVVGSVENDVAEFLTTEYAGDYDIDIKISMTVFRFNGNTANDTDTIYIDFSETDYTYGMDLFIKIGDEDPIQLTRTDQSYTFLVGIPFIYTQTNYWSEFTFSDTRTLPAGTTIKLYMKNTGSVPYGYGNNTFDLLIQNAFILGNTSNSGLMQPIIESLFPGDLMDGDTQKLRKDFVIPPGGIDTYISIVGQTLFPDTTAQTFFIHDAARSIIDRITDQNNSLTSESMGNAFTSPSYEESGCESRYIVTRGLQIRQYSLSDKPMHMSWKQWWDGAHPILNLGLGYTSDNQIEIEKRDRFFNVTPSVLFDYVEDIIRRYDHDVMVNKVDIGFQKWQSENISGIDDPQTKHSYATRFKKVGKPLTVLSDWIAASLAIENTRRATQKKSLDYKFDDESFIISLNNVNEVGSDLTPETDDNFSSITGLKNPGTRYNSRLTPARSLIRWITYLNGALQTYVGSLYKFVSGEGNYDMESDLSGGCDDYSEGISEKQNIIVTDDYLHLPEVFEITVPMYWDQYLAIRNNRKQAIGISQTADDHTIFFIKQLSYDICHSKATILAWPKNKFSIQRPEFVFPIVVCNPDDDECASILSREVEGGDYRLTEDGQCREIE